MSYNVVTEHTIMWGGDKSKWSWAFLNGGTKKNLF